MDNDFLMQITERMPMKTIQVNGMDYLQRYFAGYVRGGQHWLHRFIRDDSERHVHTHPWRAKSTILCGGYKEQYRPVGAPNNGESDRFRYFRIGDSNEIFPQTLHRIVAIEPNTWTMLYVFSGREENWKFIADDGSEIVMRASAEDWHLSRMTRPVAA